VCLKEKCRLHCRGNVASLRMPFGKAKASVAEGADVDRPGLEPKEFDEQYRTQETVVLLVSRWR
jgi:hypothetical protein